VEDLFAMAAVKSFDDLVEHEFDQMFVRNIILVEIFFLNKFSEVWVNKFKY